MCRRCQSIEYREQHDKPLNDEGNYCHRHLRRPRLHPCHFHNKLPREMRSWRKIHIMRYFEYKLIPIYRRYYGDCPSWESFPIILFNKFEKECDDVVCQLCRYSRIIDNFRKTLCQWDHDKLIVLVTPDNFHNEIYNLYPSINIKLLNQTPQLVRDVIIANDHININRIDRSLITRDLCMWITTILPDIDIFEFLAKMSIHINELDIYKYINANHSRYIHKLKPHVRHIYSHMTLKLLAGLTIVSNNIKYDKIIVRPPLVRYLELIRSPLSN